MPTLEGHLKAILGEQLFALAARAAEVDALTARIAALEAERQQPPATPGPPLHLVPQEPAS